MPQKPIWKSRKFLMLVLDVVLSLVTYFVTKYAAPAMANDVLFVIGLLQPVFVTLIASIAYEDSKIIPIWIDSELWSKAVEPAAAGDEE